MKGLALPRSGAATLSRVGAPRRLKDPVRPRRAMIARKPAVRRERSRAPLRSCSGGGAGTGSRGRGCGRRRRGSPPPRRAPRRAALGRDAAVGHEQHALGPLRGRARSWTTASTPTPRRRTSSSMRKSWSWWPMSRWAAGSSSSSTRGSCARPRASVASWRSPAESVPSRRSARAAMPVCSSARATAAWSVASSGRKGPRCG